MSAMMSLAFATAAPVVSDSMKTKTEVVEVERADTRGRSLEKADDHHYSRDYRRLQQTTYQHYKIHKVGYKRGQRLF